METSVPKHHNTSAESKNIMEKYLKDLQLTGIIKRNAIEAIFYLIVIVLIVWVLV